MTERKPARRRVPTDQPKRDAPTDRDDAPAPMGSGPGFGTAASGANISDGGDGATSGMVDLGRGSGRVGPPRRDEQGAVNETRQAGDDSIGEAPQQRAQAPTK